MDVVMQTSEVKLIDLLIDELHFKGFFFSINLTSVLVLR